jgi:hypothetical protein
MGEEGGQVRAHTPIETTTPGLCGLLLFHVLHLPVTRLTAQV